MGLRTWLGLKHRSRAAKRADHATVRIFRADPMRYTIFARAEPTRLPGFVIEYLDDPERADIILASRTHSLASYGNLDRRFMIWTAEPRYSLEQNRVSAVLGVKNAVGVMNVHTGLIYQDNYLDLYAHRTPVDFSERMRAFASKPNRMAAIYTCRWNNPLVGKVYHGGPLMIGGVDVDLTRSREALAMQLHEWGHCDLYGRGWPDQVKVSGESRDGEWWAAKRELLRGYAFNLAFENTYVSGYVTEKIWDAVAGAALPIYYDVDNGVSRDFPRGSFIEGRGKTAEQLRDEILQMPKGERTDRYEACLRAYLPVVGEDRFRASRRALSRRTGAFIEEMMSSPPVPATG